jgi:hypothetical protein
MILIVGLLLIALGLISGAALLASEMGWLAITHGITLWFMFPFGSALGLLIAALGARRRSVPALLKLTGSLLLLLSMAAVVTLVLASAGILPPPRGTAALWYVFGIGLAVGMANFLAPASPSQPA